MPAKMPQLRKVSFWGTSSPDPLPGLRPWTPLGDFRPPDPLNWPPPSSFSGSAPASVHQAAKLVAALLRVAGVTAGLAESNGSLSRVYDSRHLQADCQEPGSAPTLPLSAPCRSYATGSSNIGRS